MAESNDKENMSEAETTNTDDDLHNLLDSALDDFNLSTEKPAEKKNDTITPSTTPTDEETAEQMWSEMIKQALQVDPNIRDMFQSGSSEENSFAQDFSKIAEAAAKVIEGNEAPTNFADIMSETLRHLNESSETIQNQFGNPEELAGLFQELGLNGAGPRPDGSLEDIPPFMQNIMQSFLSKDILYPSIKDFVERYPVWLEEHKDSLPPEQYENYCKQLELMQKVVEEFEAETESDSDEVKKQRFQRIMQYMQQMQSLGHPPAELISDGSLEETAMPSLPPGMDPSQCSIM